jgi:hypothetical protein
MGKLLNFYTTEFNLPKLYFLHIKCIYMFSADLSTNNDPFLIPN